MAEHPEQEVAEPTEPSTKRGGIVPLVAALVIGVGGGGAIGMKTLGPKVGPWMADRATASAEKGGGHGGGHGGEGGESAMHVVDNLVVNPAGSGGSRFLLTSIAIEGTSAQAAGAISARDVEIRDAFLVVLGSKSVDELSDIRRRQALSRELLAAVERLVGEHTVSRLFIPQFVIQ